MFLSSAKILKKQTSSRNIVMLPFILNTNPSVNAVPVGGM